ncbi:MAG: glycosyltransferase family 2 protein [Lamprobacter sp.]|uniref:glycosyltransferase family 2 protein n=1 Tax=Lamprobacter sp. TaxID=3100796 RepID=UPI002B25C914|nr:glycosyltransferase family 2 protein [Lamprobacter sp.]MEA3641091.1 glycosyltransferase family 2 protein [Lamprobacter sp.]
MKFSVVTNAYNQGRFLRRCMESVLRQTSVEFEYIVVDPGSTDNTTAILEEYRAYNDPRLFIQCEPDDGPAHGLNKAFNQATGDWFIYLNADDFFLPGMFEHAAAILLHYPDADCVYGDGYITDAAGNPVRRVYSTEFEARKSVCGHTMVLQQSTFYRAPSFRKVGGFNVDNRTSWDWELLIDMSLADMQLIHAPGFWSAFAIHGESITGSQRHAAESKRNHERVFEKVMGRKRTERDIRGKKLRTLLYRFAHPKRTFDRLIDQISPQHLPSLTGGLPGIENNAV